MQHPAPASRVALLSKVQAPARHQKQMKREAFKHLSSWTEDIHQPARVQFRYEALA